MGCNKKFWATAFTLTGTMIGAGILGLPYVFAKSGFLIGIFWLLVLGAIMILANLYLAEITLRTKGKHQLAGYAKQYLGEKGGALMFFAVVFGIYSALLAYLIGEGQSLSQIITGTTDYAVYFGIGFWILLTLLLREGLHGLKKVETWGVLAIVGIILGMFIYLSPNIQPINLLYTNNTSFFLPFGVVMFALLGFTSIPELRLEIKGNEKMFKKAIFVGTLIPIILYILFTSIFIGILGVNITEIATLSFGKILNLLGIFTMLTSYLVLSFSLKDMYKYDLKLSKKRRFFWVSLVPLIIYLVATKFNLDSFIKIIGIGGVISGGLTGILILMINSKSKSKGNRKPEFKIPINNLIKIFLTIIFIAGIGAVFLS